MRIIDVFKSSTEKKLVEKLSEIKREQLNKDYSTYGRFERMRQSWGETNPNDNLHFSNSKTTIFQIYYKILKKGEYVTQEDINVITEDAKDRRIYGTKEFKKYINYLKQLRKNEISQEDVSKYEKNFDRFVTLGNIFLKDFETYKGFFEFVLKNKWAVSQKEIMAIVDITEQGKLQLNNMVDNLTAIKTILTSNLKNLKIKNKYGLLKLAQEVQNWMYGENNFYQKGAQKFVNKYKDVYDLIMKCNKNKFQECLQQLDSDTKSNISIIYGILCGVLADAYGEKSKEFKKIEELKDLF